ncbi:MAG: PKD domain-containing protein [Hymenobacter sp.]|nr:MAG: PKD domain-containing protein [Hymenobacter sp.]
MCVNAAPVALAGLPAGGVWSGPGVTGSLATGFVFTPSAPLVGLQVLTYTLDGVATVCKALGTRTITVAPLPVVAAPALPAVCANAGPLALAPGQPAGGTWSGPGVSGAAGGFVFTPSAALVGPQTLTYSVTSPQGCVGQATSTVQVLPGPVPALLSDTTLCPGSTAAFQLRASPAGGVWSGPGVTAGGFFTPPAAPGTVALTYTLGGGQPCPAATTKRITLLPTPVLALLARPLVCDSLSGLRSPLAIAPYTVRFTQAAFAGLPDAVLTWDFGDGSALVTGFSVGHTYTRAGTFQATATLRFNASRCLAQTIALVVQVGEMFVPNVFTPNGDQLNERFAPRIGGCPPRLQVFSRWGQQIYENVAYLNTWDGAGQAAGIYYFLLTPPDGSAVIKGWVELVR